jgi:hypothetical protein
MIAAMAQTKLLAKGDRATGSNRLLAEVITMLPNDPFVTRQRVPAVSSSSSSSCVTAFTIPQMCMNRIECRPPRQRRYAVSHRWWRNGSCAVCVFSFSSCAHCPCYRDFCWPFEFPRTSTKTHQTWKRQCSTTCRNQ